jgi:hypothetical protein
MMKYVTQGGVALGGGIALLIFKGIASIPILGPIVGIVMIVGGLALRRQGVKNLSYPAIGITVLGALSLSTVIPVIGALTGTILTISALGLIGFGAWQLWNYFKGLRTKPPER